MFIFLVLLLLFSCTTRLSQWLPQLTAKMIKHKITCIVSISLSSFQCWTWLRLEHEHIWSMLKKNVIINNNIRPAWGAYHNTRIIVQCLMLYFSALILVTGLYSPAANITTVLQKQVNNHVTASLQISSSYLFLLLIDMDHYDHTNMTISCCLERKKRNTHLIGLTEILLDTNLLC